MVVNGVNTMTGQAVAGGSSAEPKVVPPDQILKQIRTLYPEYHDMDDKTLLSKMLTKHPDWRAGVPPDARARSLTAATGADKAVGITGPQTWASWTREAIPVAGMTVGGILGNVPGAALGGAAGEAARQLIRRGQGLKAPATMTEAAGDIATEAALGGASEYIGTRATKPIRKVLGGVYKEAMQDPGAIAARAAAEKYGMKITAPEIAGRPDALALKAGHSGYFGLGRGITEEAQQAARKQAAEAVTTSLKKLDKTLLSGGGTTGGHVYTAEAAGQASQEGLKIAHDVFQQEDNRLYRTVDQELKKLSKKVQVVTNTPSTLVDASGKPVVRSTSSIVDQGLQVDMKPLKQYMDRTLQQIKEIVPTMKGLAGQDKSLISFIDAIKQLPDAVNFENANSLRSSLLSEIRNISSLLPGKFKGLEKTVEKLLDQQMEATATEGGAPVLAAWRAANKFHAEGARVFQDSLVADLTSKNLSPENVFKKLGADQVTDAKAVMDAFNRYTAHALPAERVALQRTKDVFRQGYLSGMFKEAMEKLGQGQRVDLKGIIEQYRPVLNVLLSGDPKAQAVRTDLNQLASFLDRQAPVKGLSHWALFEALAGAGTALWGSHGSSVQVLTAAETAPWLLTKILYSKPATKFLLDGLVQLPKGADKAGPALMRALRIAFATDPDAESGPSSKGTP